MIHSKGQAECLDEPGWQSLSSLQTEETTFRNSKFSASSSDYQVRPNKNLFSFYIMHSKGSLGFIMY